jgi:hypothetical protein
VICVASPDQTENPNAPAVKREAEEGKGDGDKRPHTLRADVKVVLYFESEPGQWLAYGIYDVAECFPDDSRR